MLSIAPPKPPLPFLQKPKTKRLPKGSPMTVVAGFRRGNFIAMAADSEEVIGDYSKVSTDKIKMTDFFGAWHMAIGGAGDSPYIDALVDELRTELGRIHDFDYPVINVKLKDVIRKFHRQHVWPRQTEVRAPELRSLIALQSRSTGEAYLLETENSLVIPVQGWRVIGIGTHMGTNFANWMYEALPVWSESPEQISNVTIFLLSLVKQAISGCGGKTHIVLFRSDGSYEFTPTFRVADIEDTFAELQDAYREIVLLMANPDCSKEEFDRRLAEFNARLTRLRDSRQSNSQT